MACAEFRLPSGGPIGQCMLDEMLVKGAITINWYRRFVCFEREAKGMRHCTVGDSRPEHTASALWCLDHNLPANHVAEGDKRVCETYVLEVGCVCCDKRSIEDFLKGALLVRSKNEVVSRQQDEMDVPYGVDLSKVVVPEQVPVKDKPGGRVIGTARLVKSASTGRVTAELTITDPEYDVIGKGCSIGYSAVDQD